MNKIAVLSANLGKFDAVTKEFVQETPADYHTWTDEDFPPITGLTPRMQYRIPKLFGWEMMPGHDIYIWRDGSVYFNNQLTVGWLASLLDNTEFAIFKHPQRKTALSEVEYIDKKMREGNTYLLNRYKNGLHWDQYDVMSQDPKFVDNALYASTVFAYRNIPRIQNMLKDWWFYQSRYWTCDQVVLPYLLQKHEISVYRIDKNVFDCEYVKSGERHT